MKLYNTNGSQTPKKPGSNRLPQFHELLFEEESEEEPLWDDSCVKRDTPVDSFPESIKRLRALSFHDQSVTSVSYRSENEVVMELEERWGNHLLVFKGVTKAKFPTETLPDRWVGHGVVCLEDGQFGFDAELFDGNVSIIFDEFVIEPHPKPYIDQLIFNPSVRDDTDFVHAVIGFSGFKSYYWGEASLSGMEKEALLLADVIFNLLYKTVESVGIVKQGFRKIALFSQEKLASILQVLEKSGPPALYSTIYDAKLRFATTPKENLAELIEELDHKFETGFDPDGIRAEIHAAAADYFKANANSF